MTVEVGSISVQTTAETDIIDLTQQIKRIVQNSRIQNGQVLIDPRTLLDGDEEILIKALLEILGKEQ